MHDVKTYKNDVVGVVKTYNTLVKSYADNKKLYKRYSFDINKGVAKSYLHNGSYSEEEKDLKIKKYLKKVRTEIIDLALNNYDKWEFFITLTFDLKDYSHDKAIDLLKRWLNNQRHLNKGMFYLLVPEFHKSGRIHFHGLVGNVPNWNLVKAVNPHNNKNIIINGSQIYNLSNYNLGFTTISYIKDKEKVSNYISKYATKELISLKNKKRYWFSRNLDRVVKSYNYFEDELIVSITDEQILYCKDFSHDSSCLELVKTDSNYYGSV